MENGFALFPTAIGHCAIAWNCAGIAGIQLPERDVQATRARMLRRFPDLPETAAVPLPVIEAIDAITALLAGGADRTATVTLDWRGISDFERRVYEITRRIGRGHTRSYGEIATELGDKSLARAVGHALGRNPFAPVIPCHRVLTADGRPGGFSAHGGALTKLRMLAIEGAQPGGSASLF